MEPMTMKLKAAIIFALASTLLTISGCPQTSKRQSTSKVFLPPEVVGTWKARESPWKIVLNPDGTVASAVIDMGTVEVKPNQTTKVEMKHGEFSTFKAGNCEVEYTPETRELFVSIEMKKIHVVFPNDSLDGNSLDMFIGPVSEDGKEWTADWIKVFDYGPRFPQDPNDILAQPLIFEKIKE